MARRLSLPGAARRSPGSRTPSASGIQSSIMQAALKERRRVRIAYETASRAGERSDRVVQPYHLALQGQSWLLTAHDSLRGTVIDFAVDRILSAELLSETYKIPPDFDPEQYRGSGWGVLRGMSGAPVHIELLVTAEEARRLRDETHHSSQREERRPDGRWLIAFDVGITPELVRWIFRWGTGCEVLAPPELRAMVAEMARKVGEINASSSQ